ncbi:hypothetical protein WR164_13680 [Philodulcilactobacillus myokoensis]|uniref:Uncharacterized protein n=1 Tax=Philodulcilactobacillus myokoensis TaxID=2929573 RepID=A0A9W6B1V0_9LACO|nr:hypothetical protein [Philodulcilactobacillus myokoensis]GLB47389.1 hypothetical protein WR164_13680 [Philodulcilactobacillus myokoensis]
MKSKYLKILKKDHEDMVKSGETNSKFDIDRAMKTFNIDKNGDIDQQFRDNLKKPVENGIVKDCELINYVYKLHLKNSNKDNHISKDTMYWHLLTMKLISTDGTPTQKAIDKGWRSAKSEKNVIYPKMIEQAYSVLRKKHDLPITKSEVYKNYVKQGITDEYGNPTNKTIDSGLIDILDPTYRMK